MTGTLWLGVFGVLFGLYGIARPKTGRTWGSVRRVEDNPERATETSLELNRGMSVLITLLGFALIALAVT